jgi:hypothetical protein
MKNLISSCVLIIVFQVVAFPQCGVDYKELLDKYCNGVYLQHQELLNGASSKITFILKKDNRYAIYMLNPSRQLPEFSFAGNKASDLKDFYSKVNKEDKTSIYVFTAGKSGEYNFTYMYHTKENACVLMAIYLQNLTSFQPGVYGNFEEMKYNNPSAPFENKINSKVIQSDGIHLVTYYLADKTGNQAKENSKVFGFSDGKNLYIKRKEDNGTGHYFVKMDNYGKYGYFEDIGKGVKGAESHAYLTQNLVDMNNGEITRVADKYLQQRLKNGNHDFKEKVIPAYKVTRTMSYSRYSITKTGGSDNNIRFRFFRAGVETHLGAVYTCSSGETYDYGTIAGIRNPTFPIDIKVDFYAPEYFSPSRSYRVILEFTINEPGTWDVTISY